MLIVEGLVRERDAATTRAKQAEARSAALLAERDRLIRYATFRAESAWSWKIGSLLVWAVVGVVLTAVAAACAFAYVLVHLRWT